MSWFKKRIPTEVIKDKIIFANTELVEMMDWAIKNEIDLSFDIDYKNKLRLRTFYYKSYVESCYVYLTVEDEEEPLAVLIDLLKETKQKIQNKEWNK